MCGWQIRSVIMWVDGNGDGAEAVKGKWEVTERKGVAGPVTVMILTHICGPTVNLVEEM